MLKRLKSVSTLLFLMGVSTGTAYAVAESGITDVKITQQNGSCTGIVKDTTGETVIGASVVVKGTTNGTITGIDGDFSLNNVKQGDIIQISFVGYKTVEVKWNGQPLNVTLKDDTEMLGEVVVTGYGGQQLRTKVTNSISKVKQESLNVGMHSNPAQALSGAVAGLKVIQSSGSPGATPTIILRGGTNLDGTGSPLVVVDGQLRDSMSDINPEDIESMDVLKDAGATALYGARASNGVILITTKRGKAGFREINFKAKLGLSYARTPYEFLEAGEYIKAMRKAHWDAGHLFQDKDGNTKTYWGNWESYLNGKQPFGTGNNLDQDIYSTQFLNEDNKYLLGRGWQTVTDPITGKEILYKNTDVDKYNLNDPAFSQDYNINMSGGNDRGTYYAGLGYNRQEGVPVNTFYERYSFITNASYKIADWLTSTSSLNYNRANWKNMPGSNGSELNYFGRVRSLPPTVLFEDEEGNMKLGPGTADGNQMYQPDQWWNDNQSDKFTMSQSFKIDILKNLSLTANMNWYYSETYQESFTKDYENTPGNFVRTRSATAYYNRDFRQTYNAVLNYNETFFLDHHVEVMLGMEYYNKYQRGFEAQGQGAPTDDLPDLSLTDKGEGKRTINSWHEKQRILSFFGRLNYDFKDKYLLSFVFRRDGYSSLLGDNRWGFFPSVAAGWRFTEEEFLAPLRNVLSNGKLRLSYGETGNSNVGDKAYSYYKVGNNNIFGNSMINGVYLSQLGNNVLTWETAREWNVGLDLGFLDGRVNVTAEYYHKVVSDLLNEQTLLSYNEVNKIIANVGKTQSQGFELTINTTNIRNKDFEWTSDLTFSLYRDKWKERDPKWKPNAYDEYNGWMRYYSGYLSDGLVQVGETIDHMPGALPGQVKIKDIDGYVYESDGSIKVDKHGIPMKTGKPDGKLDDADKVIYGSADPGYLFGFNNTLRWKNFDLNVYFYGQFDKLSAGSYKKQWLSNNVNDLRRGYNQPTSISDLWSSSNPNGTLPGYFQTESAYGVGDYYYEKTWFIRCRNITLGYNIPIKTSKHILSNVRVYFDVNNPFTITPYTGLDPETDISSSESAPSQLQWAYPNVRTYSFGLDITF